MRKFPKGAVVAKTEGPQPLTEKEYQAYEYYLEYIQDYTEELEGWDYQFISDMLERLEHYGRHMHLSEAQRENIERIYHKIGNLPA